MVKTKNDRTRLRDLALSETGFVFDPYTGSTFSVNQSALTLLKWLREEDADREVLIERLQTTFETDGADLERDLDEFLHLLRQNGILSESLDR